eukprot:TRINITY_DN3183_c0_g2_i4.p1 TRINITY_DN3183_c0_g2~~TRINITY_DN3183_c0_g2_i4.p1  ORF type:complete len:356 (+),score=150.08 TRINITY_DN3183_c0_g2_i4:28-1068(+)
MLKGSNDHDKLASLCKMKYKDQLIWILNAYFHDWAEAEAEKFWNYHECLKELDIEHHEEGSSLNEMQAHVFLEKFDLVMTVREMRNGLRSTGAILENERFKLCPPTHILIHNYKMDFHYLVNASQGDNKAEIEEAQRKLDAVSVAFEESAKRAEEAAQALEAAKQAEAAAKAAAEESKVKEQESIAAKAELEAALAELKAQEDAYNQKTETLKKKSEEGGVVSRNRAKNELAQHLGEDPLPLRRAKINQEAAVRKAERAAKAAAEAVTASEQAAAKASEAVTASEQAKQAAEAAVDAAREKVAEAEAFLEEVKSKPGQAQGAIWWMERELYEKRKYLPESKGGIRK